MTRDDRGWSAQSPRERASTLACCVALSAIVVTAWSVDTDLFAAVVATVLCAASFVLVIAGLRSRRSDPGDRS